MNINTISPEEYEKIVDEEFNAQINKVCTDYSDKKDNRIELALANVRAAMAMCSEGNIKSELRSAEHHLTRGE